MQIGTTNSAVAVMEGKTPKIIENAEGKKILHSEFSRSTVSIS